MLRCKPPPRVARIRFLTCSLEEYRRGRAMAISGPDPILVLTPPDRTQTHEETLAVQPDPGDQRPAGDGHRLRRRRGGRPVRLGCGPAPRIRRARAGAPRVAAGECAAAAP